jgi:hypothetical protein
VRTEGAGPSSALLQLRFHAEHGDFLRGTAALLLSTCFFFSG